MGEVIVLLASLVSSMLKPGTPEYKSFWVRRHECKNLEELMKFLAKFIQDNKAPAPTTSLTFDVLGPHRGEVIVLLASLVSSMLKPGTPEYKSFWVRRHECKNLKELRKFLAKFIQDNQ